MQENEGSIPSAVSAALLADGHKTQRESPGAIVLKELYSPPAVCKTFPESAQLIEEARAWTWRHVERLGCGNRLLRPINETVTMCPYLFPDSDFEGNLLATMFTVLEFVNDDIFDSIDTYDAFRSTPSGARLAEELLAVRSNPRILGNAMMTSVNLLRDPRADASTIALPAGISGDLFLFDAFCDLSKRIHAYAQRTGSPNFECWLDAFTTALIHFGRSHMQIYNAIDDLSIEEYMAHKLINCGMTHTILLLELATGDFLSRELHALPLIHSLKQHCIYVGSLLNEITSYEKEVFQERSGNLLLVVMLKQRCSLREATQYVARIAQANADAVIRLAEQASVEFAGHDQQRLLQRYVNGIAQLSSACWYWQIEGTTRYRSASSPFAELKTAS